MSNQDDFLYGTITIRVSGKLIEPFLQACTRNGCLITNIKRIRADEVQMTARLKDWTTYRRLRKKYRCKIKIIEGKGVPFIYQRMLQKTSIMLAFLAAIIAVFLLANTLWSIKVEGLTPELEASVEEKLRSYGIAPGKFTFGMEEPEEIQRKLLEDIPDLLWVGVKKKGTSYQLYGVEETRHDTDQNVKPADLVAAKKGMIIETFIKKGRPLVSVYDVVKKGQRLASGQLMKKEEDAEDMDEKEEGTELVHAEGEVIAETWYKVGITIPENQALHLTNGSQKKEYSLVIGGFYLPLWGWWNADKEGVREEKHQTNWSAFGWRSPVSIQTIHYYQVEPKTYDYSMKELIAQGTQSARQSLKHELAKEAKIMEGKLLHQRKENGKVKLILLFKVHEDIAVTKYITQGD